jgi:hypothetical protein
VGAILSVARYRRVSALRNEVTAVARRAGGGFDALGHQRDIARAIIDTARQRPDRALYRIPLMDEITLLSVA